jgi:hypothetical protein
LEKNQGWEKESVVDRQLAVDWWKLPTVFKVVKGLKTSLGGQALVLKERRIESLYVMTHVKVFFHGCKYFGHEVSQLWSQYSGKMH